MFAQMLLKPQSTAVGVRLLQFSRFSSKLAGFRLVKPEEKQVVVEFVLDDFRVSEPITRSINLGKEEARPLFEDIFDACIRTPSSFSIYNSNDVLIGCKLNSVVDFSQGQSPLAVPPGRYGEKAVKIMKYLELVEKDLPKLVPEVKRWFKFELVSVHPEYKKMGVATKMWELSFEACRKLKCEGIYTEVTALASQTGLIQKMGFKEIYTLYHKDYLDENGKRIFVCDDGTDCAKLIVKIL